ncbi:MAG: AI-2E family transporter [Chitinophagales bacterium]|nr:AI-2E family transporter [Chitinophagales bacterium]
MTNLTINLQRFAYLLIILTLMFYITIIGKSILVPIVFAGLFTFLLLPICNRIERWISFRPIAIILSMLVAILPILLVLTLFSYQLVSVVKDMPSIGNQLQVGIEKIIETIQAYTGYDNFDTDAWLQENLGQMMETPINLLGKSLTSSTDMLVGMLLTILMTFFFLLYRTSFKNFLLTQFSLRSRGSASKMIKEIQDILQEYLYGLLLVIFILGVLNSFGLWLIGIKYAAFWGFMAAFLAIIPYIGTTLGGTFPFIYALATTGTFWQPAAVVLLYVSIQTLEGNFITPKVVGSSVSINPLTAIIFLFIGGMIWGIAGLILALPAAAVLKVIFSYITPLKPFSALFSTGLYRNSEQFMNEYDSDEYRLINYFKNKEQ